MATETVKLIMGIGKTLTGRLLLFDALRMSFKDVKLKRNTDCELCGDKPSIKELIDYVAFCDVQMPKVKEPELNLAEVEISPQEFRGILDSGKKLTVLDVREPFEWDIAHIPPARLTPLSQFDNFIAELNPEEDIYLYCYKGKRSITALKKLKAKGFTKLKSVAGGIDRYAQEVDPDMPRY